MSVRPPPGAGGDVGADDGAHPSPASALPSTVACPRAPVLVKAAEEEEEQEEQEEQEQ